MFYLNTKFNTPISNGSSVTAIKVKAKQIFPIAAMLSFHILQKIIFTREAYFFKINYYMSFQHNKSTTTGISP